MMKTIRNIAAILTVLCMILTLFAGCQQQSTEKIDIGIIQLIENGAFNDMREGFVQQMKDRGYDESKANFHYKMPRGIPPISIPSVRKWWITAWIWWSPSQRLPPRRW